MVEFLFFAFLVGLLVFLLRRRGRQAARLAIIDGSNLLYWKGEALSLEPVIDAIEALETAGYRPCVVFDANAGYLVAGPDWQGETPAGLELIRVPTQLAWLIGRTLAL